MHSNYSARCRLHRLLAEDEPADAMRPKSVAGLVDAAAYPHVFQCMRERGWGSVRRQTEVFLDVTLNCPRAVSAAAMSR